MEHVWTSLSAALGASTEPSAFLTRLALVLGREVDEATWDRALRLAELAAPQPG